ncbi:hypothetical protein MMC20_001708 [Loxospora ochrophaea]|nr:hypothetical protein [Loxospora ochrophaea]
MKSERPRKQYMRNRTEAIEYLDVRRTVESKVGGWDSTAPDDEHNTEVIKLITKGVHFGAVVGEGVKARRQNEANGHSAVKDENGNDIAKSGGVIIEPNTIREVEEETKEKESAD